MCLEHLVRFIYLISIFSIKCLFLSRLPPTPRPLTTSKGARGADASQALCKIFFSFFLVVLNFITLPAKD